MLLRHCALIFIFTNTHLQRAHVHTYTADQRCMPTHVDPRRPVSRASLPPPVSPLRPLHAHTRKTIFGIFARGVRRVCTRRNAGTSELHARPARARACGRAYAHARPAFDCILRIYSGQRGEYVPFPRFLALSLSLSRFFLARTHTHTFLLFPRVAYT